MRHTVPRGSITLSLFIGIKFIQWEKFAGSIKAIATKIYWAGLLPYALSMKITRILERLRLGGIFRKGTSFLQKLI
jgi:hypothetical protein